MPTRILLLGALAVAISLVTIAVAPAAGKRSCKSKKEDKGCRLPKGADYFKAVKEGSSEGQISLGVVKKGWSVSLSRVYSKCDKFAPSIGDKIALDTGFGRKGRPKVGKKYTVKGRKDGTGNDGTVAESFAYTGTVKFKSARRASLKFAHTSIAGGELQCQGSLKATLKRRN